MKTGFFKVHAILPALTLMLLLGAQAKADFTFNETGPIDSAGAMFTGNNTVASSLHSTLNFSGDLTEVNTATFASEARFRADGHLCFRSSLSG